jgi:hypothetical protein
MTTDIDNRKIYIIIGFPKCGTTSFQKYFEDNNIKSCHQIVDKRNCTFIILQNRKNNKLLLSGLEDVSAFTQIDNNMDINNSFYPQLTCVPLLMKQYPNAKFILNTRNVHDWIKSINKWNNLRERIINANLDYLPRGKGKLDAELIEWYNNHITRIKKLFINEKERLLIFNIDKYNINELNQFCGLYKVNKFPICNVSKQT